MRTEADLAAALAGNPELARLNARLVPPAAGRKVPASGVALAGDDARDTVADVPTSREEFRRIASEMMREHVHRARLAPEDALQMAVVAEVRRLVAPGGWACLALMVANEVRVPRGMAGSAGAIGSRLLAMGLLPGAPDLAVMVWPGVVGWIELKRPGGERRMAVVDGVLRDRAAPGGSLSPAQRLFRDLCRAGGHRWACCRSTGEVVETLAAWGAGPP